MRELARRKRARVIALTALVVVLAAGATLRGGPGATATAETPATALPANPPMCTAKTLGVSRASNPGLAADCDTLLAIKPALRASGWINYDTPQWWDHSYALNWSARAPLEHWRAVTLGGTPLRVTGLDFSDTRETVKVLNARTRQWEDGQPFTREWTLRGVIPTQLGKLTALETLDLGGSQLTGSIPTQLGNLTRLRTLDLSNNRLTGELPKVLDDLDSLGRVRLAGNAFTGCAPAELWRITSHDLDALGLPNCKPPLTYGAPSWTGIVDAPGEHAFFTNRGPAITYEALRNDVIQVVIHKQDAGGVSRDAIYDDVEVGDDFEWREASDCWVRYLVERVLPDPTDIPLKVLAVRRYGYAYTGCSGMVSLTGSRTLTWVPPNIQLYSISAPIRYGPWQARPPGWMGEIEPAVLVSVPSRDETFDEDEVKRHPLWRTPDIPAGWGIHAISANFQQSYGVTALYVNEEGYLALETGVYRLGAIGHDWSFITVDPAVLKIETRIIDGYPAIVEYSPSRNIFSSTFIMIYDERNGVQYSVMGYDVSLKKSDFSATIDIARSLLPAHKSGE